MTAIPAASMPFRSASPAVTLVIGSGGVRCAAALGVVNALDSAGIGVERVVGCSAGSIFAALVAFGYSIEESKAVSMRCWSRELTRPHTTLRLLRAMAPRLFGSRADGLRFLEGAVPLRHLTEVFGDRRIEGAALPLHLAATDLATGELVELVEGILVESLRASLSMPPAVAPQRVGNRLLVDGQLADPLPVSLAIKHGARVIVAVGFEQPLEAHIEHAGRFAFQLNAILANNLLRAKLAFHGAAHHAEMIVIIPEFKQRAGLSGTDKLAYIIDEGEQAALQQLPYLHHLLATG